MPSSNTLIMLALLMFVPIGCGQSGPDMLKTRGQLMKGGEKWAPDDGSVDMILSPISPDGKPPSNLYVVKVNQAEGSFVASGPRGEGVPPGEYRVSVEWIIDKKDVFKGRYDLVNSPLIVEIDRNSPPLMLDIDGAFEEEKEKSAKK